MRRFGLRLLPGALVVAAATLLIVVPWLRSWTPTLLPVFPYAVFGAGILLGWRFGSPRAVLAVIVLALADQALGRWGAAPTPSARAVFGAVALLVPLNLAALAWMSERRGRPWAPRIALGVILLETVVVVVARPRLTGVLPALGAAIVDPAWLAWTRVPQIVLLAFLAALAAMAIRFVLAPRPLEGAMVWALVAAFLGLRLGQAGLPATVYLAAGGLALVVGLVETSYSLAYHDELTGLPARRALNDALSRLGPRYAVAMVDIDHFKRFNDAHGHDVGDQLLRMVAGQVGRVGAGAQAYRWGGEEFAILFPGMTAVEARPYCESLRQMIEMTWFTLRAPDRPRRKPKRPRPAGPARKRVAVTVSIGVADGMKGHPKPAEVIRAADQALYRAKEGGRNRVAT